METLLNGEALSILKNPFEKEKLTDLHIRFKPRELFGNKPVWTGSIDFKNGSTSGCQYFKVYGEDGIVEIVKQMDVFIKSL